MKIILFQTICLIAFTLFSPSCKKSISHEDLVGTYLTKKHGEKTVVGKIEKREEGYFFLGKRGKDEFKEGVKVMKLEKEDVEQMIDTTVTGPFAGLKINKNAALLKMPKGWSIEEFKTETGYCLYMRGRNGMPDEWTQAYKQ